MFNNKLKNCSFIVHSWLESMHMNVTLEALCVPKGTSHTSFIDSQRAHGGLLLCEENL